VVEGASICALDMRGERGRNSTKDGDTAWGRGWNKVEQAIMTEVKDKKQEKKGYWYSRSVVRGRAEVRGWRE